jgi:hypothetical protein
MRKIICLVALVVLGNGCISKSGLEADSKKSPEVNIVVSNYTHEVIPAISARGFWLNLSGRYENVSGRKIRFFEIVANAYVQEDFVSREVVLKGTNLMPKESRSFSSTYAIKQNPTSLEVIVRTVKF